MLNMFADFVAPILVMCFGDFFGDLFGDMFGEFVFHCGGDGCVQHMLD